MIVSRASPNEILAKSDTTSKDTIHSSDAILVHWIRSRNSSFGDSARGVGAGRVSSRMSLSEVFWIARVGNQDRICVSIRQLLEDFLFVICFIHDYCRSSFIRWQNGDVWVICNGLWILNQGWTRAT